MAERPMSTLLAQLHRLVGRGVAVETNDRELLRRYAADHDEAAFAVVVRRHGPMVLGVCRRLLGNSHDADDAFQAVFLVLAKRAARLAWQESVAGWLSQVACHVSLKARSAASLRRRKESEVEAVSVASSPNVELADLRPVLDEEVRRLPAKYRQPIVLCYFEGRTNDEAARELGWPTGTVKVRLLRGRDLLRSRLTRRGVSLSLTALGTSLSAATLSAAVPAVLMEAVIETAVGLGAGPAVAASATVNHLAQGVLHDMFLTKMMYAGLLSVTLGLSGAALGWVGVHAWAGKPEAPKAAEPVALADDKAKEPVKEPVAAGAPAEQKMAVVKGNNSFALDLYGQLSAKPGNLFYSPYSISTALAMTYAGARNETARQMENVLRFPFVQDQLHPAYALVIKDVNGDGKPRGFDLYTANRLWGQKNYAFLPDFMRQTQDHYGAGLEEVDFVKDTEGARKTINGWVEKQTKDKIQELLAKKTLDENTRLVLTNAIYFKASWLQAFDEKKTKADDFRVASDRKVNVPFMHNKADFNFYEGDDVSVVELPYDKRDLSMLVILPRKAEDLGAIEKVLSPEGLTEWQQRMKLYAVDLSLPKFKVESTFSLKEVLMKMGMTNAFGNADFSGMTSRADLFISNVYHKAFVDVNEKGTEAAAATAVVMFRHSIAQQRPKAVFRADHPFLFVIRENRSGSLLFLGRVVDPQGKS